MKTDIKIKWKLFLYMFIFVFAMLIVLWLFQTVFLADFYKAVKTQQIKSVARLIGKNIDNEQLPVIMDSMRIHDNSLNIVIFNETGEVSFFSRLPDAVDIMRAPTIIMETPVGMDELIIKAKQNGESFLIQQSTESPEAPLFKTEHFADRVFLGKPGRAESIIQISEAVNKNNEKVYILIRALITPVDATVSTLRYQLILVSFILLLLAVALSLIISRKFARPIMEINEVAKQLTVGNYNVTFSAGGYREIDELNNTLNSAAHELSRVETLRRELLANVSHDLRTPLTMITGFAEMIKDLPGENTPENAQVIIDESNRLTRLVSDLLDISKLEDNGTELLTSVFCLTDVIRKTAERITELSAFMDDRRIIFDTEERVSVNANEGQIIQVIYNLIVNAVNYSDGDVIIKQFVEDSRVRIEVHDSGHGIAEKDLPYIWDRYYKASEHHKRANIGTGLGLSIVRGVIGRHNGTYGVISGEGEGSIFWFELEIHETSDLQ